MSSHFTRGLAALLAVAAAWAFSGRQASADDFDCEAGKVCRNHDTQLPLRALLRPNAVLRDAPSDTAKPLEKQAPFQPWFVFQRKDVDYSDAAEPKGWYQVNVTAQLEAGRQPKGWVQARDLFEWKNAIVVSYSDPGTGSDKRGRVLMFEDVAKLKGLVAGADGPAQTKAILADLDAGKADITEKDGVVMAEPKTFLNINKSFYILPVLDFEPIAGLSRDARYLRVAAAVPQEVSDTGRAASGGATLENAQVRRDVARDALGQGGAAKDLAIDIKFVLDMTASTQPYLDATREAVIQIANDIITKVGKDAVSFGLVGYTDVAEQCNDPRSGICSFAVTKNFTPKELVSSEQLKTLLARPDAQATGGGDWPETVFDGVMEAVQSPWRDNSVHYIIQIGDASSNLLGQKGAVLTEDTVRSQLEANTVWLMSIHIKPTGARVDPLIIADEAIAERQFRRMAENTPQQTSYFDAKIDPYSAKSDISDELEKVMRAATKPFVDVLASAQKGRLGAEVTAITAAPPAATSGAAAVPAADTERAAAVGRETAVTGLIEYLGRKGERPRDLVAWVADVDPTDPSRDALDVRVLMTREELEELLNVLTDLQTAFVNGKATQNTLFDTLQTVVTGATLDRLKGMSGGAGAVKTAAAIHGLLPNWIKVLPYQSELQRMTFDDYDRLTPDEKAKFEKDIDAKLTLYKDFDNDKDVWHDLSPELKDKPLQQVYAMKLSDLP